MKILFDNKITDATITSLYENNNYLSQNLSHVFLWTRYQSLVQSDTITAVLDVASDATSFWLSYHNLSSLVVRFYDSYDLLLYTLTVSDLSDQCIVEYFNQIDDISYITLQITTLNAAAYIGGIALGLEEDWGSVLGTWPDSPYDNSVVNDSDSGQSLQNKSEILEEYEFTFRDRTNITKLANKSSYKSKGIGGKVWVDPFEENHDYMLPFYGTIRSNLSSTKNGRRFDYPLKFREAH